MTDLVLIQGLRIDTVIGVYQWEKEIWQTLVLDLELACDVAPAAAADDIQQALDYAAISDRLTAYVSGMRVELIETVAERCATLLLEEFAVVGVRLTVNKPGAVPQAESVGVRIVRGQGF
ncbi:dihydroneopterin aldolase [Corallincola spongiicola]|uniref:7,8-dihydroneopterin aldolase n=1 Tax=Corallincola spongiicola TaxID=2520508 RepID=A0ABY1WR79_9GAMM|nr:dihydroneopterin aldolase [Corallincola spongiicola]TAA47221.1 dihydroneopterin aldolase [Corallincola spongiicola]